jgi:hypothetical protein
MELLAELARADDGRVEAFAGAPLLGPPRAASARASAARLLAWSRVVIGLLVVSVRMGKA